MKLLCLTIAALHVAVVLAPCPGEGRADRAARSPDPAPMHATAAPVHAHHAHGGAAGSQHAAAHAKDAADDPPPDIKARCGCGCGSAPAAASAPNARIGYGLLAASPRIAAAANATDFAGRPLWLRPTPPAGIDHVPIAS